MPVSAILDRKEFVEWLGGNSLLRSSAGIASSRLAPGHIMMVWESNSGPPSLRNLPLISVPKSQMRDFFAFTSTYISTYAPFSAFFRVVPSELLEQILDATVAQHEIRIPEEFVGIAIAEAYVQTGGNISLDKLSIQAGLATVSSSVIAAVSNGYVGQDRLETVLSNWALARDLLVYDQLKVSPDAVAPFWLPLLNAMAGLSRPIDTRETDSYGRAISFVRRQLTEGFSVESHAWRELTKDFPEAVRALGDERSLARERQVENIDFATTLLLDAPRAQPLLREVAAGFLIARLSGGSFEYLRLCDPFLDRMPRAALWFAFFAGLQRSSNVMFIADCLGRRLARQLFAWAGPFSSPVCDIGFYELEAQALDKRQLGNFRKEQQNVTLVELLPGVTARYRMSRETGKATESRAGFDRSLLNQLRVTLMSATRTLDRIADQQPNLFGDPASDSRTGDKRIRNPKR
ncbi:MAG: hypothetical protein ACK4UO_07730 [Pseudolabrys sp.]